MIEWSRVNELRNEIGEEDFAEVVEVFLEEVEEVTDRLSTAADAGALESDLHFLKGSAMNLGFAHFSMLCQHGERMAKAGRAAEIDLPAILQGYQVSKSAFQSELATRLAG